MKAKERRDRLAEPGSAAFWRIATLLVAAGSVLAMILLIAFFPKDPFDPRLAPAPSSAGGSFLSRGSSASAALLLPEREVLPGRAFPCYRSGERISVEARFEGPRSLYLFRIEPDGTVLRADPAGFDLDGKTGLVYLVLVASRHELSAADLSLLMRKLEGAGKMAKGVPLLGILERTLVDPRWEEQILLLEKVN